MTPMLAGVVGSFAAGMLTAVGALPMLWLHGLSARHQSVLLGVAAGVMLAASFFSLIIPGIDALQAAGSSKASAAAVMGVTVLLGAAAIGIVNRRVAIHLGDIGHAGNALDARRRLWLFVAAITLHNLPEGMAVGVSFGGGDTQAGWSTALGIGIQNLPEGMATAVALISLGYGRLAGFGGALASGLVEPVGGLLGVSVVSLFPSLLPSGLGFAAGAMIYVVASEMIPETQGKKDGDARAIVGFMLGLVVMMFLDIALG